MAKRHKKPLWLMDMSIVLIGVMVSQIYSYVTVYQITYFKYVQFIVCQFYFSKTTKIIKILSR